MAARSFLGVFQKKTLFQRQRGIPPKAHLLVLSIHLLSHNAFAASSPLSFFLFLSPTAPATGSFHTEQATRLPQLQSGG